MRLLVYNTKGKIFGKLPHTLKPNQPALRVKVPDVCPRHLKLWNRIFQKVNFITVQKQSWLPMHFKVVL